MPASTPIHIALAITFAFTASLSAPLSAQSRQAPPAKTSAPSTPLPPTSPTSAPIIPPTPAQLPPHPASVTYANGLLTVSADNSSLNQILRDISRETKMKIVGGVTDERVFGQYGPAPAGHILNTLLDGTNSNIILVQSNGAAPAELLLSPRGGGPTPPNPNAAAEVERQEQIDEEIARERSRSQPPPEENHANTPPSPTDAEQTPGGVKTPQQIFDQLQRLRQQQASQNQK